MRIHVISIGGRIMHNLALVMQSQGHQVTGSDDEIYEPSKSRLDHAGLLPNQVGWDATRITNDLDLIVLGMHAKSDNPELIAAQQMDLKIMSYPEYIYEASKDKKRVVVAGSHGKTTTTSMIMHVLKQKEIDFDFLVGAELDGFDGMVKISEAPLIIIEGDEYLSSAIDRRPKMLHYIPDLAVITGIAWDHINVFPTYENYVQQFGLFLSSMDASAVCYIYDQDQDLMDLAFAESFEVTRKTYEQLFVNASGKVIFEDQNHPISVFGDHNLANMKAAMELCYELGIGKIEFLEAIKDFKGAAKRLEVLYDTSELIVYRDFAHAPSKVKATSAALRKKHPNKKIAAIVELHTYSSLNKAFIPHYKDALESVDELIVFYNEHTIKMKRMELLDADFVKGAFGHSNMKVITDKEILFGEIQRFANSNYDVFAIMSSGNLQGTDLNQIFEAS